MCAKLGHVNLTMPRLGLHVIHVLGLVTVNVCAKSEVPTFTRYSNMKHNAECIEWGDLGG